MKLQEYLARHTEDTGKDLFRVARATAEDKLNWKPMEEGRTVLNQLQECAAAALFFIPMLESRGESQMSKEEGDQLTARIFGLESFDEVEAAFNENTAKLLAVIRSIPDEDLEKQIKHPFRPDKQIAFADMLLFHYWNCLYHLGQINYIQTLYGDKAMH